MNAQTVIQKRLASAVACLDRLVCERLDRGDPQFGKEVEERIVWRELLDLEFQEFDEEIERLSALAHTLVSDSAQTTAGA